MRGCATAVIVVASWFLAIIASGVAAVWLAYIWILVAIALAVCLVSSAAGAWFIARRTERRRRYTAVTAVVSVLVLAVCGAAIVARPLPSDPLAHQPSAAPEDVRYWDLPTGSHLAYRYLQATGPGEAVVNNPAKGDPYRELTRLGYDVYLYDQVGAGLSARLTDPADYTVGRHVADLEAVREHLDADQLILIGASRGGSLVASYLAAHPTRVARAVLTSPAPMDYARWPDAGDITAHLPDGPRQRAQSLMPGHPRFVTWYGLGVANPLAAHNLVSDDEADAFFDTFLNIVRPATVCEPAHLPDSYETGNGLYANVFTTRDAATGAQSDVFDRLRVNPTPVLIVTGECNYIPWAPTAEYATTLPNATLLCLPNAGHAVELDRPDLYRRVVQDFLLDQPTAIPETPPTRPCTSEVVPG